MKYKVGQRIEVTEDCGPVKVGMKGKILAPDMTKEMDGALFALLMLLEGASNKFTPIAIQFDYPFEGGHDVNGRCKKGYGYIVPRDCIKPCEEYSITITVRGDETKASLYRGKTAVKDVVITRNAEDKPSVAIAAKAAVEKLFAKKKVESRCGFTIGQRVRVHSPVVDGEGRVIGFKDPEKDYWHKDNLVLIEFDEPFHGGHDGLNCEIKGRKGKYGYCWYINSNDIKAVK